MEAHELGVLALLTRRYDQLRRAVDRLTDEPAPKAGERGPRGPAGPRGEPGPDGPPGPAPAHRWSGSKLAFKQPDGRWGASVDLRGPAGGAVVVPRSTAPAPQQVERIEQTDYDDTRYAYVGYPSKVVRLDYAVSPPARAVAVGGRWEDRHALTYVPG